MATSPSFRVERLWEEIQSFTPEELRWLNRKLLKIDEDNEEEGGGAGVREPRRPRPESPGDAIVLLSEDEPNPDVTQNFELTPEERTTT